VARLTIEQETLRTKRRQARRPRRAPVDSSSRTIRVYDERAPPRHQSPVDDETIHHVEMPPTARDFRSVIPLVPQATPSPYGDGVNVAGALVIALAAQVAASRANATKLTLAGDSPDRPYEDRVYSTTSRVLPAVSTKV